MKTRQEVYRAGLEARSIRLDRLIEQRQDHRKNIAGYDRHLDELDRLIRRCRNDIELYKLRYQRYFERFGS